MAYTADFETTTDINDCRVWAFGLCDINNPELFMYGNSIEQFINLCSSNDYTLYFHNLKFDGEFIINCLFRKNFKHVTNKNKLKPGTFTTLISDTGQFYTMEIEFENGNKTKIIDSLKILPFSVEQIAKAFNLPIEKQELDYKQYRKPGHELTEEERKYLYCDVSIVARALKVLFEQDLKKITQGSNALYDFKKIISKNEFEKLFPVPDYDEEVRKSYRGGWTYLNENYADKDIENGIVLDVNSLYPSVMYYELLPYGEPIKFSGKYKKDEVYNLYTITMSCQFELKQGYLPTIQMKNNLAFIPTEYLKSSNGETVILCLTSIDYDLFFEHYNVYNAEYYGGWKFKSTTGIFKNYIDKWNGVKMESTKNGNTGMRTLAKLMLNALYGKFALNPNVCSKIPYFENGLVKYKCGAHEKRDPIYIAMGTFITAYARKKTISSAQKLYPRFIYADTDSLHLSGTEIPTDLEIDSVKLGAWKHESTFTRARFLRQKSYIEEIEGKLNVTCAGMPKNCHGQVTWENFKKGSTYSGKLQPEHVPGGIVLKDIDFTIKL